jgi:hypothetical protein
VQAAPTTGFESTYVANQHLMKRLTEMVQKEQQKQAQQAAANGGRRRGILPVQADDPELEAALQQVMPVLGPLSQYNQQVGGWDHRWAEVQARTVSCTLTSHGAKT